MKFGISIKLNDLWVSVESHFKVLEFYIYYKDGKKYWEPFDGRNAVAYKFKFSRTNEVESEIDLLLDETISTALSGDVNSRISQHEIL